MNTNGMFPINQDGLVELLTGRIFVSTSLLPETAKLVHNGNFVILDIKDYKSLMLEAVDNLPTYNGNATLEVSLSSGYWGGENHSAFYVHHQFATLTGVVDLSLELPHEFHGGLTETSRKGWFTLKMSAEAANNLLQATIENHKSETSRSMEFLTDNTGQDPYRTWGFDATRINPFGSPAR